ncbi:uncharacterized protein LOC134228570 [Saccostrea cucullata]|uniref:uncharacterized protein LOC134228570 n=1 Tax=Saccostrea cuccullata TaxID=36930 RepID=UPI002ED5798D
MALQITKPIITRGCHNVSSQSYSILRKDSLEENNVTNCYQFCFLNQSGSTVKALLMRGGECICSVENLCTSFNTAKRCTESCPGNSNQNCGGYGSHTFAVYEIENINSNDQNEGCGFVNFQLHETEQRLSYGDCNKNKMAYCTMLFNVDGTVIKTKHLTWDEHNNNCSGHLAFIGDTKTVKWKLDNAIQSGFTFWVGHRIWNYVPIEFDEADSSNNHDDTESEIFINEINESSGDTADSSNDHDGTKRVVLRDEINKSDDGELRTIVLQ